VLENAAMELLRQKRRARPVRIGLAGATVPSEKPVPSLRDRHDPVAQGRPAFTTISDSARKGGFFRGFRPEIALRRADAW
jgi:hypothetical protein